MDAPPTKVDLDKVSDKDKELLVLILQSLRGGEPKINYPRLAEAAGMPMPKTAMNAWGHLKKKLQLSFGSGDDTGKRASPGKRAAKKPKKAVGSSANGDAGSAAGAADVGPADFGDDDMVPMPLTPLASPKASPAGRKRKAAVLDKEDEDETARKDGKDGEEGMDDKDGADDKDGKDGDDADNKVAGKDKPAVGAAAENGDDATDATPPTGVVPSSAPATPPADTGPVTPKKKKTASPRARGGGGRARGDKAAGGGAGRGDSSGVAAGNEENEGK